MKTIYIAGKVTGEPIAQCTMKFGAAQKKLGNMGYKVLNPLELVNDFKCPWKKAMLICLEDLMDADEIYMLSDWQQSKGARIEYAVAKELGLTINFEKR